MPQFNSTTPVTFSLQARDWNLLVGIMRTNLGDYEELLFNLKVKYQVPVSPSGTDLVEVTDQYLGPILFLCFELFNSLAKKSAKLATIE